MSYNNVLPWSYSSLTAFETCPRRFKLIKLTKEVSDPPNEAAAHGNEVHKALENALKDGRPLPEKYAQYQPMVNMVRMRPGKRLVEYKFALTAGFRPTEFFAKDAWCRGVIDAAVLGTKSATVMDWKTGKVKEDHDQLKLFAGVTFAAYPYIEEVRTGYVWLAHNKLTPKTFTKDDTAEIWQEFLPRVQRLTRAAERDDFPPKPSGLCTKWCPVPNSKCEFSGRTR